MSYTTENSYVGNGSTVLYSFTFPYINEDDIYISLDAVRTTEYTLANATTVEFNTAPASGVVIRIFRTTDVDEVSATFFPGSAIRAQDLNSNFEQTLYVAQELQGNTFLPDGSVPMVGNLDLGGFDVINGGAQFNKTVDLANNRITNVAAPVDSTDAANRAYVDNRTGGNTEIVSTSYVYYTATQGDTVLTSNVSGVPVFAVSEGLEQIYVNGALQQTNVDYVTNSTSQITFTQPLLQDDVVAIHCINNIPVGTELTALYTYPGGVQQTVQDRLEQYVSVKDFGAAGDDVTDDLAAFNAALAALPIGGTLYIPSGNYRVSGSIVINQKFRTDIKCAGTIKPHGSFDGYLMTIANTSGDPIAASMGLQMDTCDLTFDCEWQCRGVSIDGIYDSAFNNLTVWRAYGTSVWISRIQEAAFYSLRVMNSIKRVTPGTVSNYAAGTAYSEGSLVKVARATYNPATTYDIGDFTTYGGKIYRCILNNQTGNQPDLNASIGWEFYPQLWYKRTANQPGASGFSPQNTTTNYLTTSGTTNDKIWEVVFPEEPALLNYVDEESKTHDNCKFFGLIVRSCENSTLVMNSSIKSAGIIKSSFFGSQVHLMTRVYADAHNAQFPSTPVTVNPQVLMWFLNCVKPALIDGNFQTGNEFGVHAVMAGHEGADGSLKCTNLNITAACVEETLAGSKNVGLSVGSSISSGNDINDQNNQSYDVATGRFDFYTYTTGGVINTGSIPYVDPNGATNKYVEGTGSFLAGQSSEVITFPVPLCRDTYDINLEFTGGSGGTAILYPQVSGKLRTGFTLSYGTKSPSNPISFRYVSEVKQAPRVFNGTNL